MLIVFVLCSTGKMTSLVESARWLSAFSFIGYGLSCFFSLRTVTEFNRYKLGHLRRAIGILQIAGSLGLLAGLIYPFLTLISSLGLTTMMLLAVLVRIKIKDSLIATTPALLFFGINLFIFIKALEFLN